jgi:hypothetical protein
MVELGGAGIASIFGGGGAVATSGGGVADVSSGYGGGAGAPQDATINTVNKLAPNHQRLHAAHVMSVLLS